MGTSTNRPKPKSSQSAAKNGSGKSGGTQPTTTAKSTSGTLPTTSKTPTPKTATQPTTKTTGKAAPAASKPTPAFVGKRDQKREDMNRRLEERRLQREREQRNRTLKRVAIFGIPTVVVAVVIGILIYTSLFKGTDPWTTGQTIDGIQCNSSEQFVSHYHAHLLIYVNGQEAPIPTDVGRQSPGCLYWLHTHPIQNDDGVIHIESPDSRTYTVKQFFDIWGKTFTSTDLLGKKIDSTHQLTVYVYNPASQPTDGSQPFTVTPPSNLQPYTGDPTQITLKPHELIVLEYGTPTITPPAFTFIAGE